MALIRQKLKLLPEAKPQDLGKVAVRVLCKTPAFQNVHNYAAFDTAPRRGKTKPVY
jgi:hypothetical protein